MKAIKVVFKVTKIEDVRKSNSLLEVNKEYSGFLNTNNNSVFWEDSGSGQSWVFWVGDTCKILKYLDDGLNINLKIEAKSSYVIDNTLITLGDLPRSEELKMYYSVFEDCFLKKFVLIKESKKMKRSYYFKNSLPEKINLMRIKFFRMSDSLIYLNKKIEKLENFNEKKENSNEINKLELQVERIINVMDNVKNKIDKFYFSS
ncbi:hypothetical protein [Flavobacterium daejeonense]|uniref:hypothetical protein n=1 Tax=Flavobacterium daejeonense TaxID=350893 RepID=UPI00047EFC72|nr:hypothetical protein [Flavobacterium daejeonense]